MTYHVSPNELKLIAILKYAPVGLVEINDNGDIAFVNIKAEELLNPIFDTNNIDKSNLFPVVERIAPGIVEKIKAFTADAGIIHHDMHLVQISVDGQAEERHIMIVANKQVDKSIMLSFDDS